MDKLRIIVFLIINFILRLCSLFIKKRSIIFFENGDGKYADSVKDVYENIEYAEKYYVINNKATYKKMKNNRVLYKGSIRYFLLLLRTKIYVTNYFINPYITKNLKIIKISIFHGYGTKKIPSKKELEESYRDVFLYYNHIDYFITMSEREKDYFGDEVLTLQDKNKKFVPLGLPRNDSLFLLNEEREFPQYNSVLLFAPTWREAINTEISKVLWPFEKEDTIEFLTYLKKTNQLLIIRPHPFFNKYIDFFDEYFVNSDNVTIITNDMVPDTKELLRKVDILITDYSSIFVDFLLLNRPIYFIDKDLKEYIKNRGLVVDYNNDFHTPGYKIKNLKSLIACLNDKTDDYEKYREKARSFYHKYIDSNSTERSCKFILGKLFS